MKSSELPSAHPRYPVRLMVQDACIILTPSILMLIGVLWAYKEEWRSVGLANWLASLLPFS